MYDIKTDEWSNLPLLNPGRIRHSMCNFEDKYIYTFGGRKRDKTNTRYFLERIEWIELKYKECNKNNIVGS